MSTIQTGGCQNCTYFIFLSTHSFLPFLPIYVVLWLMVFFSVEILPKKALHSYEVNFSHAHNTKMTLRERRRKNNCPIL